MTTQAPAPARVERDQHLADIIRDVQAIKDMPLLTRWEVGEAADGSPWLAARIPAAPVQDTLRWMRLVAEQAPAPGRHIALDVTGPGLALTMRVCCAWISLHTTDQPPHQPRRLKGPPHAR